MKFTRQENNEQRAAVRVDFSLSLDDVTDILLEVSPVGENTDKEEHHSYLEEHYGTHPDIQKIVRQFLLTSGHPAHHIFSHRDLFNDTSKLEQLKTITRVHIKLTLGLIIDGRKKTPRPQSAK